MVLRDISFPDPVDNISFDEVLLELAEQGRSGEILRMWESQQYFIVLGRNGVAEDDANLEHAARDGVVVLRRCSGGGTVLQGPGCLNFTLILQQEGNPALTDIRRSYQFILEKIIRVLQEIGISSQYRPISDLVTGGKEQKFSGNAQRRRRKFLLHHGTILYHFDIQLLERYLKIPKQMPEYRRARPHQDFLVNIPVARESFCRVMQNHFAISVKNPIVTPTERELLKDFRCRIALLERKG
jgi:lipoate---protein ligase